MDFVPPKKISIGSPASE